MSETPNSENLTVNGTDIERGTTIEFIQPTEGYMPGAKYEFTGEFHGLLARFVSTVAGSGEMLQVSEAKLERWEDSDRVEFHEDDTTTFVSGLNVGEDEQETEEAEETVQPLTI